MNGRQYMEIVAGLGCCICQRNGYPDTPAEVHHIRTGVGMGRKASDFDTIPLCPYHHRQSRFESIHGAGRKAFERFHGVTEIELATVVGKIIRIKYGHLEIPPRTNEQD